MMPTLNRENLYSGTSSRSATESIWCGRTIASTFVPADVSGKYAGWNQNSNSPGMRTMGSSIGMNERIPGMGMPGYARRGLPAVSS